MEQTELSGPRVFLNSGRLCAKPSPEVSQHRDPHLGGRLCLRDHEGGTHESRHVARAPLEVAQLVRPRLRDATEFGEQAVTWVGIEQPGEWGSLLRERLAIQLERRYRELSIDEILGAS